MNVILKPELEALIAAEVKAGRSSDSGEFLNKLSTITVEVGRIISEEGLGDIDQSGAIDGDLGIRLRRPPAL